MTDEVIGQQDGDHPVLLKCEDCGSYYETDESVTNDCPSCGSYSWEMLEGDPSEQDDWRNNPESYDPDA